MGALSFWLEVDRWLTSVAASGGYRGLLVLHASAITSTLSTLLPIFHRIGYKRILCVAPSHLRSRISDCEKVSPAGLERVFGREYDVSIIASDSILQPNLLAAVSETVRGGGVLTLLVPPLQQWQPGGPNSRGVYKRYLVESFYESNSILWGDVDTEAVYVVRYPPVAKTSTWDPDSFRSEYGVPRKLVRACATEEQAKLLDVFAGFLRSRGRSFIVIGDRGRGKSGFLALAAALLIQRKMVGFLPVTAPTPHNVQSFFAVLIKALKELDIEHHVIERYGLTIGVSGRWFHVRYHTPDQVNGGSFTIVDEAAAIGPARLRRIIRYSRRLLIATTVHGYEGSGRTFTKMVIDWMPEPKQVVSMQQPIRYAPGDPLEEWLYETLVLRPYLPKIEKVEEKPEYVWFKPEELVVDRSLLRQVYSVLVEAHYRNEPNDLAMMIDAPHYEVHALLVDGKPLAVAETAYDSCTMPYESRMLVDLLSQYVGELICVEPGARVVRIAVYPQFQRQGYGSKLLAAVEKWGLDRGLGWIGAVFSRSEVVGFWLRNGYYVVYISPRFNKVTGEKNIAVAKPLTQKSREAIVKAAKAFLHRLLFSLPTIYRDLPAETVAHILYEQPRLPSLKPLVNLPPEAVRRLEAYVEGKVDYEAVWDVVFAATINIILLEGGRLPIESWRERVAYIARVLQWKPVSDVARIVGVDEREVHRLVDDVGRMLVGKWLKKVEMSSSNHLV